MITPERGKVYIVKHSSGRIRARFIDVREIKGYYAASYKRTHYIFQNLGTGRDIELKSKIKILSEVAE